MPSPAWLAATPGSPGLPGQINQFLTGHNATFVYQGTATGGETTGSAVYASTQTQWLAQAFTTGVGQTAIGSIQLQLSAVGGSPTLPLIPALTLALYASSNGLPAGSPLASTTVPCQYVYSAPFWVTVPLLATGLTPSLAYQLVLSSAGSSGHYYTWQHSNQASGAATSTSGTSWTAHAFGLMYQIYDQSPVGSLQFIVEDSGARWARITYDALNRIHQVTEYTAGQSPSGYLTTTRTCAYSNGLLTGVA